MSDENTEKFIFSLKFSENLYEIYYSKKQTLLKYAFQGGIDMVNGFSSIFMVASVTAVSGVSKTKRDERRDANSDSKKKNAERLFASILENSAKEKANEVDCRTTTYGRDSMMQNFLYQTREYRY